MIILGFDGTEMSSGLQQLLSRVQPAGVILFARNIATAQQTHKLLKDCQRCVSTPLVTCVDMEGGRVDRFRDVLGAAPSAADVFVSRDSKLFRKHGRLIGDCCRSLGFNTDFAPVVDLALEASQTVMRSRAVSPDPKRTTAFAKAFLAGLASARVLGAIKHFPGLGGANLDTHEDLPTVARSWKTLWAEDLAPYRLLRRVTPMVLVGHASYSSVTRDVTPASLSKKWISEVLRKKIGYRGLVVSDDLEMGGVLKAAPIEQAAVGHIRAGGDLCLICHKEDYVVRSYETLLGEFTSDRAFAKRCMESVNRVLAFKRKNKRILAFTSPPTTSKVEKLSRQLWEFGEQVRLESIKHEAAGRYGA